MAPERPTSPQDEIGQTPKMSVPGSPVAGTPIRDAQSPISILLAVAQSQNKTDDDLTNLNWLHEKDLLKGIVTKNKYLLSNLQGMNIINPSPSGSIHSTTIKPFDNQPLALSPTTDYEDSPTDCPSTPSYITNPSGIIKHNKHPHNIPYDPLVHTNNKPPYSFSCLIFMAIEDSVQKALPVKEIYAWILEHFPYFKNAPTGWKNSVRHNLSLNKCFQKVEKAPNLGKGSLWTVDPQYKPNLIQALNRTPTHSCLLTEPSVCRQPISEKSMARRMPNPELFPYLAKKLAATEVRKENRSEDALDDVDAAAVMLSLKNSTGHRGKPFHQVITTSPSEDHTYSAADTLETIDRRVKVDGDQGLKNRVHGKSDVDEDEQRRIKEGAETLLNLAGITVRKRSNGSEYVYEESDKRVKVEYDINENVNALGDMPIPCKPRLLRKNKVKNNSKAVCNNNNEDDWVKHRRGLEGKQHR